MHYGQITLVITMHLLLVWSPQYPWFFADMPWENTPNFPNPAKKEIPS